MDNDIEKCLDCDYREFESKCLEIVRHLVAEANKELSELGCRVSFDEDYDFDEKQTGLRHLTVKIRQMLMNSWSDLILNGFMIFCAISL